jgi:outer membrane protein OmpA-like peptidoglycan-associated protein
VAGWSHQSAFAGDLFDQRRVELPSFDTNVTTNTVQKMQDDGTLEENVLHDFEINFKPNQTSFPISEYEDDFNKVIDKVSTYAGAVLTIEGHSDPFKYLKMKHDGAPVSQLRRIRKSAENLSYRRADRVREAIIDAAGQQGLTLDESQFTLLGRGIEDPKTGMCGPDPCPPQTKTEWLSNMRVVFKLVQMEAEANAFTPPNDWQ